MGKDVVFLSHPELLNSVDSKLVLNRSQTDSRTFQRTTLIDGVIPGY